MTSMNYNLRTRTDAVGVRVLSIPCQQDKNCCSLSKSKFFRDTGRSRFVFFVWFRVLGQADGPAERTFK